MNKVEAVNDLDQDVNKTTPTKSDVQYTFGTTDIGGHNNFNGPEFSRVLFETPQSLGNSPQYDMFAPPFRTYSPPIQSHCNRCNKDIGGCGGTTYPCAHRMCSECASPISEGSQCPLCSTVRTPQYPAQMFLSPVMTPDRKTLDDTLNTSQLSFHNVNSLSCGLQNVSLGVNELQESFGIWDGSKSNRNSVVFESLNSLDEHPPVFSPVGSERFSHSGGAFGSPLLSANSVQCAGCGLGSRASGFCMNCQEPLCNECIVAHQRVRVTKDHHVVALDQLLQHLNSPLKDAGSAGTGSLSGALTSEDSSSRPSSVCCIHDARVLAICDTCCGTALCFMCLPLHSNHQLAAPNDVRAATTLLLGEAKQREKNITEALESVHRMGERIDASAQAVVGELRSVIHLHISALEERKRELLQRLETIRSTKMNTLKVQGEKLMAARNRMGQVVREAEAVDAPERFFEQLLQAVCLAVPIEPQETDLIKFIAPDNQFLAKIRNLGELESEACASTTTIVGERYRRAIRDRLSVVFVQLRNACGGISGINTSEIQASVTAPDGSHLETQIIEREAGLVGIGYLPVQNGMHYVNISIRGTLLADCPVNVEVRKGRNYNEVAMVGERFSFGTEGSGDGELCRPWGICIDAHGRVLVADRSNNRIQIFDKDGNYLSKFGSGGTRPGQFDRPAGITTNTLNNVIVADKDNHRVQVFDENGTFLLMFGERGRPVGMFNYPWGVACNSQNHIAVSDTRNHRVQIFNAKGQFMRKCGFDTAYFYKHLDSPRGLAYLPDGQLLITDFNNHRLAVWSSRNGTDMKVYGSEGEIEGQFCRPQGITTDPEGHILVCDSRNNRIQVFSGEDMRCVAVFGMTPPGFQMPAELPTPFQSSLPPLAPPFSTSNGAPNSASSPRTLLDRPTDIAVGPDGRIYVVDFGNNCIRVF